MASKLHRPNNFHSIFKDSRTELPGLEAFYNRLLHIPCGWWVSTEDRERIVEIVKKAEVRMNNIPLFGVVHLPEMEATALDVLRS